jgi:hypothetical protein
MTFAGIRKVVREIHSEPGQNGTLSWGRIAASASLIAAITWVTHLVIHTGTLPALDGISGFVVAPYAANRIATAVQSFSSNPVIPNPNQASTDAPKTP